MTELNHTRYLTTNEAVCENPSKLGHDLVIGSYDLDKGPCFECIRLMVSWNDDHLFDPMLFQGKDKLGPARGVLLGCLIGSVFWIMVAWILWAVFAR